MIDCHVLISSDNNREWFHNCLWSLRNENVNLHVMPAIHGNLSLARTNAFKVGICPYVSYVDADDMIVPGIYNELLKIMDENSDVVCAYTDQLIINSSGIPMQMGWSYNIEPYKEIKEVEIHNVNEQYIHHLHLIRREALLKCLPLKTKMMPEPILMCELSKLGRIAHLNKLGYFWRLHGNNAFLSYTEKDFIEAFKLKEEILG